MKISRKTEKSHITYIEKKKTFREDFFLMTKRSFKFLSKVTILAISRLKSYWIQMVQTDELLRTKKKQTYIISPTSRKRRLLEKTFFNDKEKFQVFLESDHFGHI